jgi:formylglycine-generating enzyme required for sulfatase activity
MLPRSALSAFVCLLIANLVAPTRPAAAPEPLAHEWRRVEGHWQIVSPASDEDLDVTDASDGARGRCREGMVEVEGKVMWEGAGSSDEVEALQSGTCTDWINRSYPERCARYDPDAWAAASARIPRVSMHFCIDRYEYPNHRGAYPWIMVGWDDALGVCARKGKRLCTEQEWTFACEGEEALPYPYGYERDAEACVIDRPWRPYDAGTLYSSDDERARAELDRLWQGEASGAFPRCRSPFGVYDMTGNVDEWTTSVVPRKRPSILKGGYWGPVRTWCRATTRSHGETFAFYQIGFRCCSDVPDAL